MHLNTSDGADKALAALKGEVPRETKPKPICPDCGAPVTHWYSANQSDPGDVDPRADCTKCEWGY